MAHQQLDGQAYWHGNAGSRRAAGDRKPAIRSRRARCSDLRLPSHRAIATARASSDRDRLMYTQIARRLQVTHATLLDQLHSFKLSRVNLHRSMTQLRLPNSVSSETGSSPISPINV